MSEELYGVWSEPQSVWWQIENMKPFLTPSRLRAAVQAVLVKDKYRLRALPDFDWQPRKVGEDGLPESEEYVVCYTDGVSAVLAEAVKDADAKA